MLLNLKPWSRMSMFLLVAGILSIGTFLHAAEESEEGFTPLFNGQNLDGWIIQGMEKAGPKILPDGIMQVGGWDYWAVITKKEFKNFILRLDVKFDERGNSGILFHTPKKEIYKSCFEIQLMDDASAKGDKKKSGAICDFVVPAKNVMKPIGEWNSVEVQYVEPKLTVKINGEVVQNEVDITKIEGLKHKLNKGGIALQRNDYFKAAYFKNIRVKELPE